MPASAGWKHGSQYFSKSTKNLEQRVPPGPLLQFNVSQLNTTLTCNHTYSKDEQLSLTIMKTDTGRRTINLTHSYHIIPSASLIACPLNKNYASDKTTARNPSAMPNYQIIKPLSSNLPSDAHSANLMNSGSPRRHYMGYNSSPDTGLERSTVPLKRNPMSY